MRAPAKTLTAMLLIMTGATLSLLTAGPVAAQGRYPERPVRLVVTVPPGGAADLVARTVAEELGRQLNTQIVVENRAGASGTIASSHVAKSAPDGDTLLQSAISTHGIGPHFFGANLNYRPFDDLIAVAPLAQFPLILAVNAGLPVKSVAELIELAKKQPLSFASAGTGSAPHLSGELLMIATGIRLNHVPYKGSGPATVDVAGGVVNMMFDGVPAFLPYLQSGKLRPLAAVATERNPVLPDLPTFTELGYPTMVAALWYGLMAPAGTPSAIVDQINAAAMRSLAQPDVRKKLEERGANVMRGTAAEFAEFTRKEHARWGELIRVAKVPTTGN
jgi:tripartite-type tricarboxylate transporter receptor subunit TctC